MSRPKRFAHYLKSAKEESLFACDVYNQHRQPRTVEAFLVHMGIAWCNLLQAIFERDGVDYCFRNGRRYIYVDGERKSWDLSRMVRERFPDANDPIRKNLEFFIGLRNKVEHRLTRAARNSLRTLVAGKAQAYLRNFEALLTKEFGSAESLAHDLHLPLFISSLDEHAVQSLKDLRKSLPRGLIAYIEKFDANVPADVADDQKYEFRLFLIPQTGKSNSNDMAVQFINADDLTEEQRAVLSNAFVISRERHVETANLKRMLPGAVVKRVKERHPRFTIGQHGWAWQFHEVRPRGVKDKNTKPKTNHRYCLHDDGHNDYVYTEAWVSLLLKELDDGYDDTVARWRAGATGTSTNTRQA